MSNSKIHIDQLFSKGLLNLEIPVFSNDFENITKELPSTTSPLTKTGNNPFEDFELAVTDSDWQIIRERLAEEKNRIIAPVAMDTFKETFKDFEIAVTDTDWQATKSKLKNSGKKKIIWWWWLNMFVILSMIGMAIYYFSPSKLDSHTTIKTILSETKPQANEDGNLRNSIVQEGRAENSIKNPDAFLQNESFQKGKNTEFLSDNDRVAKKVQNNSQQSDKLPIPVKEDTYSNNSRNENEVTETFDNTIQTNKFSNQDNTTVTEDRKNVIPLADDTHPTDENRDTQGTNKDLSDKDENDNHKTPQINPVDTPKNNNAASIIPAPKAGLSIYAGIVTDIYRTGRHLSKENETSYNSIRNDAEKPFTQFSYGIVIGLQKGKNQFQSGFQLTEQTFTSNYDYILKYQDSIPVYDPNGKLIGKFPIGPYKDTLIRQSDYISHHIVDIPLTYNRFWTLNPKTQLITGFAGVLSIIAKNEGSNMLNPANNQLYSYSYLKDAERKLGFSPKVNIGIQRKIAQNLFLQGDLYGRYSVTNRYDTDFSAKEYPYSKDSSNFTAKEYLYSYGVSVKLLYLLK